MPGKHKPIDKTKTLEHARKRGDLERFVKGHAKDPEGDLDKLDEFIRRSTGVSRPARGSATRARKASSKASSGD